LPAVPKASQRPTQWVGPTPDQLLDRFTSQSDVLSITWWQFEEVVAAMFKRLGYHEVVVLRSPGADAGVDIRMRRDTRRCIVQCRHYPPNETVSVDAVRAFAFVAIREKADEAIFITTGQFSAPCHVTAGDSPVPMILIDGRAAWDLVLDVRKPRTASETPPVLDTKPPTGLAIAKGTKADFACPSCGGDIVRKFDSKREVGFWGCNAYPKCRWAAYDAPAPGETPRCFICGGGMILRDGKYGKFWGCTAYPACRGTRLAGTPTPSRRSAEAAEPPVSAPLSPDGNWMWNGSEWVSTLSPDGMWRWDGREWKAAARR
jgi:ssDNA-binding Zn-finger/Zn-ribbon topoisomerase 1